MNGRMAADMAMAGANGTAADGRAATHGHALFPPQTARQVQGRGRARQAPGGRGMGRQRQAAPARMARRAEAGTAGDMGMGAYGRLRMGSATGMRGQAGSGTDAGTAMRADIINGTGRHKGRRTGPGTGLHGGAGAGARRQVAQPGPRAAGRSGPRRTAQQGTAA
ncbi:hypothetical protein B0A89_08465 [Paracoccus contaminans]|uniref:Uncharacterized protein n=1 Tax=Paracoccus contaminans TaxID=1945662 RepID=A0A1W6CXP3_9RHOB|nr:hypothetical protein B0A89_08465 [Paracoccus contaminans]